MEYFYRYMRKKLDILVENNKPLGGKWNYDAMNRQPLAENITIPQLLKHRKTSIVKNVIEIVAQLFPDYYGDIEPFNLAVTRKGALKELNYFIEKK